MKILDYIIYSAKKFYYFSWSNYNVF